MSYIFTAVVDASTLLWVISLPREGTVADYIGYCKHHIGTRLTMHDVYLVFDR